jgi:hypothetical protein
MPVKPSKALRGLCLKVSLKRFDEPMSLSQVWNTAGRANHRQRRPAENHMHHETWPPGVRHGAKGLGSHPRCHRSRRPRSNWAYHTWSPGWSVPIDRLI